MAHPCVDKSEYTKDERVYHKYYQWVYFVLFFQALCFYAPHFFWKSCESTRLRTLTVELKDPLFNLAEKEGFAKRVVLYLERNRGMHQKYYHYFALFEVMNLVNVLGQMYVVDVFLGGAFTTYGLDVLNYIQMDQDDRVDPMVRVFPRMTKCTFHRFGASGDVQRHDALCILPLNIINEKIYIIMWFWFVFLAIVSGVWLIYRLLTFVKPTLRYEFLKKRANLTRANDLQVVLQDCPTGDWFLYSMMCKNMDSRWFRFVIKLLAERLIVQREKEYEEMKLRRQRMQPRGGGKRYKEEQDNGRKLLEDEDFSSGDEEVSLRADSPVDIEAGRREKRRPRSFDGADESESRA